MFPAVRVKGIPDAFQGGVWAQKVNVPVWPRRQFAVMRQSRANPAGSKGAADIQVAAGPQLQFTEPPNAQAAGLGRDQNQRVGARVRGQWAASGYAGYSESNTSLATRTALAAVGQPA